MLYVNIRNHIYLGTYYRIHTTYIRNITDINGCIIVYILTISLLYVCIVRFPIRQKFSHIILYVSSYNNRIDLIAREQINNTFKHVNSYISLAPRVI